MKQQHSITSIFILFYIVISLLYIFADQWIGFKNAIIDGQYWKGRREAFNEIIDRANKDCQPFRVVDETKAKEAYLVNTSCLQTKSNTSAASENTNQDNASSVSESNP